MLPWPCIFNREHFCSPLVAVRVLKKAPCAFKTLEDFGSFQASIGVETLCLTLVAKPALSLARRAVYWILLTGDFFLVTTAQVFPAFKQILEFEGVILTDIGGNNLC